MDRENQQPSPDVTTDPAAPRPSPFAGLAASAEADFASDLERIASASWDIEATKQRIEKTGDVKAAASTESRTGRVGRWLGSATSSLASKVGGGQLRGDTPEAGRIQSGDANGQSGGDAPGTVGGYTEDSGESDVLDSQVDTSIQGEAGDYGPAGSRGNHRMSGTMADPVISQDSESDAHEVEAGMQIVPSAAPLLGLDRLQSELSQAREELNQLRNKSSAAAPTNGSADGQRQKLDQRAIELRERVVRAQQALDERARKLRATLTDEREKLKAYHAQLQRKARQLDEASRNQKQAVDGELAKQRDLLDAERTDLERRRIQLDALEADLRDQARHELTKRRKELEGAVETRLGELQREFEVRQVQLDSKERSISEKEAGVEQIIQKRLMDVKHQSSQWQLQLEEKERSLHIREQQLQHAAVNRLEQVKRDAASFEAELLTREQKLGEKEALMKTSIDSRIATLEREHAERQAEFDAKLRNLFEREGQLNRTHESKMAELRREWETRESEFQHNVKTLADQEARLRQEFDQKRAEMEREASQRQLDFENKLRTLSERDGTLQDAVNARLEQVKREAATKSAELDARERALRERDSDLQEAANARIMEMRREVELKAVELEALERSLTKRETDLESVVKERIEEMQRALSEKRSDVDRREREVSEAEGDLKGRREAFEKAREAREAELKAKAQEYIELAKLYGDKSTAEATMAGRRAELELRQEEVARRTDDIETRERRLREWQGRLESMEPSLETSRLELQRRQAAADHAEKSNQQIAEQLAERTDTIRKQQEDVARREDQLRSRIDDLNHSETSLRQQHDEILRLKRSVDEEGSRLKQERERYADLEKGWQEHEKQRSAQLERAGEITNRESALKQREVELSGEIAKAEHASRELAAARQRLDIERSELSAREETLRQETFQVRRLDEENNRIRAEIDRDRVKLVEAQTAHAQVLSTGERRLEEIGRQHSELADARSALQLAQAQLQSERTVLRSEQAALQQDRQRLATDRSALDRDRQLFEEQATAMQRDREDLGAKKSQIESELAHLERDRLSLKDRERTIAEQKSRLETAQREVDDLRRELVRKTEETDAMRRVIAEKSERMRDRKTRLAEDAALVDTKLKQLNGELETVRLERVKIADERTVLDERTTAFETDRQGFSQQHEELNASLASHAQARAAFDEEQQRLADREARLTERGNQLEAFGIRLKSEYAELQKQRAELVEIEARGDAQTKISALLKQAEERESVVRQREQALSTQERALSAVAAEVSAAEDEIKRKTKGVESRTKELEQEIRALEKQRREFQEMTEEQRGELTHLRRQAELEIARERDKLREQERELEIVFARQRDAIDTAGDEREEMTISEMRRRVEASLAERMAEIARKEQQVERRCERRIAEVESDIEQRLAQLSEEIKSRREQAPHELPSVTEQIVRAQVNASMSAIEVMAPSVEELPETNAVVNALDEKIALATAAVDHILAKPMPDDSVIPSIEEAGGSTILEGLCEVETSAAPVSPSDDRVWLDESAEDLTEPVRDMTHSDFVLVGDDDAFAPIGSAVTQATVVSGSKVRKWAMTVGIFLLAIMVGGVAGTAYLYAPAGDAEIRGVVRPSSGEGSSRTLAEHMAALSSPDILIEASKRCGNDLQSLARENRLNFGASADGRSLLMSVRAPRTEGTNAQGWLDALARVYQDSLAKPTPSKDATESHLRKLEADRQEKQESLEQARRELESAESALADRTDVEDSVVVGRRRESLKTEMTRALSAVGELKGALQEFESEPAPSGPIVPSEAQLVEAQEGDVELRQALEHQQTKATQLHAVVLSAMSKSVVPFAGLLTSIDVWLMEIRKQVDAQSDKDIKKELEMLAVDVTDYLQQARHFEQQWNELQPKVEAWRAGGEAEALAEYQKQAETLIRDFHAKSRNTFAEAAKKSDDLSRGGTEMAQRRILQSSMTRFAHDSLAARNTWTIAARGVVPRYEVELKTLLSAVADVGPRIAERKAHHRERLADQLMKVRADEHHARHERMKADLDAATHRHEQLSDEFLKAERAATASAASVATIEPQKKAVATARQQVADLEAAIASLAHEIERVPTSGTAVHAGSIRYDRLGISESPTFDLSKVRQAIALGAVVSCMFVVCVWVLSRNRPRFATQRA